MIKWLRRIFLGENMVYEVYDTLYNVPEGTFSTLRKALDYQTRYNGEELNLIIIEREVL